MARKRPKPSAPPSPDRDRKPDQENVRRTSNPKSPKEQVNAISDDIRTEVTEYIKNFYLESMITVDLMKSALNAQESQIEDAVREFTSGGKKVLAKSTGEARDGVYESNLPFLKKLSTDAVAQLNTPDSKPSKVDNKPPKKPRSK